MEKKRRWFQLHLSTLVTGVIAVGLLGALNILPHEYAEGFVVKYGWPFDNAVVELTHGADEWTKVTPNADTIRVGRYFIALRYVALDLLVLIACFAVVATVLEKLVRRKRTAQ